MIQGFAPGIGEVRNGLNLICQIKIVNMRMEVEVGSIYDYEIWYVLQDYLWVLTLQSGHEEDKELLPSSSLLSELMLGESAHQLSHGRPHDLLRV